MERDARENQLLHMSRSHELEDEGQVCVLLGDLNLREGEQKDLERESVGTTFGLEPLQTIVGRGAEGRHKQGMIEFSSMILAMAILLSALMLADMLKCGRF